MRLIRDKAPHIRIGNFYGPTEAVIDCIAGFIDAGQTDSVPIGKPMPNYRAYILDAYGRPLPVGVPGELCIGGEGLARGYLNRPELTAKAFIPNPFAEGRMYKTGDLARWLADGSIEYLGRIDQQVKIRGFRIEPGEIESVLKGHPSVEDAIVHPFGDAGRQRLCAYLVGNFDAGELRQYLSQRLPDYMVPAAFMAIDAVPLTPSGKVDRKALPHPEITTVAAYTAPRSETEKVLCAIFSEVLGIEKIGIHDNFFEAGGDSILALQVISKSREMGFDLAVRDIFKSPRIEQLALRATPLQSLWGSRPEREAPLTPVQKWFYEQIGERNHYNQSMLVRVPAGLELQRLEQAVRTVLEHHDALRLAFRDGRQMLQGMETLAGRRLVKFVDCSGLPDKEKLESLYNFGDAAQRSLDIAKGDLFRCLWFDYGNEPGRLLLIVHHLAVDGVSWRILIPDLQAAYEGKPLPEKTTAWTSWAAAQKDLAAGRENEIPLWQEIVEKQGVLIKPEAPETVLHDQSTTIKLTDEETRTLIGNAPSAYHANPEDLLLAGLCLGLEEWLGRPLSDGILVNLESHGREELINRADLSRTVGWFTAQYPVRLKTHNKLRDTLIGIKETLRSIPDHGIGYGLLRYGGHQTIGVEPQVSFNYLGRFTTLEKNADWTLAAEKHGSPISNTWKHKALLDINSVVAGNRLEFNLTWPSEIFTESEMEELKLHLAKSIRQVLSHCRESEATHTTSDFPLVKPCQGTIDRLFGNYPDLEDILPLTPLQQGILFHSLESEGSYQVQLHFRVEGDFDPERFRNAMHIAMERHEILRMAIPEGETAFMVVNGKISLPYLFEDWRHEKDRDDKLQNFLAADRDKVFELSRAPLLRLAIFQVANNTWEIVLNSHHLILDGWSLALVMADVLKLYGGESLPRPRPYADYAEWLKGQAVEASLDWWQNTLAGFEKPNRIDLPVEKRKEGFGEKTVQLGPETTRKLDRATRELATTRSALLQAIWATLISRLSGDGDVVFGNVVSGRPAQLPGIESMVGMFINTVPVRVEPAGKNFRDIVSGLTALQAERDEHEYAPLHQVQGRTSISEREPAVRDPVRLRKLSH